MKQVSTMAVLAPLAMLSSTPAQAAILFETADLTNRDSVGYFAGNVLSSDLSEDNPGVWQQIFNSFTISGDSTIETFSIVTQNGINTENIVIRFFEQGSDLPVFSQTLTPDDIIDQHLLDGFYQDTVNTINLTDFFLAAGNYSFTLAGINETYTVVSQYDGVLPTSYATDGTTITSFTDRGTAFAFNGTVNTDPTPVVPEPASWAMMIGGFALAGAAMRRRRVAASFAA